MRGLVLIVIALFMVSCGSQGNYVTFKAPTFNSWQIANPGSKKCSQISANGSTTIVMSKQNWCSIKRAGRTCTNNIL